MDTNDTIRGNTKNTLMNKPIVLNSITSSDAMRRGFCFVILS